MTSLCGPAKKCAFLASTHIINSPPHCARGADCIGNRSTSKGITHSPSLSSPLLPAAPAFLQRIHGEREYGCQIGRPSKLTPKHSETNSTSRPLRQRYRSYHIAGHRCWLVFSYWKNSGVHLHYIHLKGNSTEPRKSLGTWLREISSCSSLTFLPGPAWVLLSKICKDFLSSVEGDY